MLFTVLVMSLILTIAIGISNMTFKQAILSGLAKDSQVAFYQADTGTECGMYYDLTRLTFPPGTVFADAPDELLCGTSQLRLNTAVSTDNYFLYENRSSQTEPCMSILFDKTDSTDKVILSRGYNICDTHPRKVERALEVRY